MSKPLRALLKTQEGHERWTFVSDPPPTYLRRVRTGKTGIDYDTEVPHIFSPGQEIRFKVVGVVRFPLDVPLPSTEQDYATYMEENKPYPDWYEITKQMAEEQSKQAALYATNKFKGKYPNIDKETEEDLAILMKHIPPKDFERMEEYLERLYWLYKANGMPQLGESVSKWYDKAVAKSYEKQEQLSPIKWKPFDAPDVWPKPPITIPELDWKPAPQVTPKPDEVEEKVVVQGIPDPIAPRKRLMRKVNQDEP